VRAYLTVLRAQVATEAAAKGGRRGTRRGGAALALLPLTVPEVRRLLWQLVGANPVNPAVVLHWSHWRRRHQARAKRCHYRYRGATPP